MDNGTQRTPERKRPLLTRLDAAAQDLNAILLVVAVGLAVLDFTCFFAFEVGKAIPVHQSAEGLAAVAPAVAAAPPPSAPSAGKKP
jgi:hypothetical protein